MCQPDQGFHLCQTWRVSSSFSSVATRVGISSLSRILRYQLQMLKGSSWLRLSATQILIGPDVKDKTINRRLIDHYGSVNINQLEMLKVSSRLRLSATQIQIGPDVKDKMINRRFSDHYGSVNINIASTGRTQASVLHSSPEAELFAMTQASVETLAINNFMQKFRSMILSRDVSIVVKTDSSASKTMASRLGLKKIKAH